tara:strand:- start:53 stop:838 length:786 start_codon:yes stop_codon:yes gene_type:complete
MDARHSIINTKRHPIDDLSGYALRCRDDLKKNSILILYEFLTKAALLDLQEEAKELQGKAFYCSQSHNVFLEKNNTLLENNHPYNIKVVSDKGCIPNDLVPIHSHLRAIYASENFKQFIKCVFETDKIYPYADTLSSININYYEKNQQLGWHFDSASFAITLMIQSSTLGGKFQYVVDARNVAKKTENFPLIGAVLKNNYPVEELQIEGGALVLFCGSNCLHRVTPINSAVPRILATLNYNLEKDIELSENARLTFFGRLH